MYFETSSPTRTGHKAMLLSPLYPKSYSRRCFKFWYHILAVGGNLHSVFPLNVIRNRRATDICAPTYDFQQCGISTSVDTDEPVRPPFKLRNSKLCSASSLIFIEYSSD